MIVGIRSDRLAINRPVPGSSVRQEVSTADKNTLRKRGFNNDQIKQALTAIRNEDICPISQSILTVDTIAVTDCNHVFNKESLAQWLDTDRSCPCCRSIIAQPVQENQIVNFIIQDGQVDPAIAVANRIPNETQRMRAVRYVCRYFIISL